jgi:hypothetical protein
MRRLVPLALFAALVIAGCGSSAAKSTSSAAAGPNGVIGAELSYFPAGDPFVLSIQTNPASTQVTSTEGVLSHFPLLSAGESLLIDKLQSLGVNYETQLKPLFGHPALVGLSTSDPTGFNSGDVLIVWQTASAAKLATLLKPSTGAHRSGTDGSFSMYNAGAGTTIAVSGPTVVLGLSPTDVRSALARHAEGAGFSAAEYTSLTSGLPRTGLIQAFGDLSGVLSNPRAAKARTIPWVGAIHGYGVTVGAQGSGLGISFRLDTTGATLTSAQLPLAAAGTAPSLAGSDPISVGLTNPGQSISFLLNILKLTSPHQLAKLHADGLADLDALAGQLTGTMSISSDTKTTLARAAVTDPAKATSELDAVIKHSTTSLGGGFYRKGTVSFGVSDKQFVIGNASVAQLKAFTTLPSTPAPGPKGTLVFRVQLLPLLKLVHSSVASSPIVGTVLAELGDVTGSVQSSPSALTGNATLAIK